MIIQRADACDWFTAEGVARKRNEILRKGWPDTKNWRFTTLTLNQDEMGDPLTGYLEGKERMRRFLYSLREIVGHDFKWAWKLEFHADGWPHWHLIWEHTSKLSLGDLLAITQVWGLGRPNTKRIRDGSFDYLFKYVTKGALKGGFDGIALPDWFLDYQERGEDGRNETFQRVRFWQTSRGFYTGIPAPKPPAPAPRLSVLQFPVRQIISERWRKVRVIAVDPWGKPRKSVTVLLKRPWHKVAGFLGWNCILGRAASVGLGKYVSDNRTINNLVSKLCQHKLRKVQQANQNPPLRHLRQVQRRLISCEKLRKLYSATPRGFNIAA